jgi:pyrroline-5-carboxylate reductase
VLDGTLVLLGAGNMGGAMLQGWLNRAMPPARIVVLDPAPPAAIVPDHFRARHQRSIRFSTRWTRVEVLVLAVKPQAFDEVLPTLAGLEVAPPAGGVDRRRPDHRRDRAHFGEDAAVIRAMPNVPAAIGRGITAMVANPHVSAKQLDVSPGALLEAIGEVVTVEDEDLMDAVTAVSGSGPAYVFYLAECLAEAGMAAGLPEELATRLARATVSGSGRPDAAHPAARRLSCASR